MFVAKLQNMDDSGNKHCILELKTTNRKIGDVAWLSMICTTTHQMTVEYKPLQV